MNYCLFLAQNWGVWSNQHDVCLYNCPQSVGVKRGVCQSLERVHQIWITLTRQNGNSSLHQGKQLWFIHHYIGPDKKGNQMHCYQCQDKLKMWSTSHWLYQRRTRDTYCHFGILDHRFLLLGLARQLCQVNDPIIWLSYAHVNVLSYYIMEMCAWCTWQTPSTPHW